MMAISCVCSGSERSREGLLQVQACCELVGLDEAEALVVLGGDGFLLESIHAHLEQRIPFFGMNRGTVGFLMNEFRPDELPSRVSDARREQITPLRMISTDIHGKVREALAYNEVALVRASGQAANLSISVDGKVRMETLIADGVMVATPAGSTAYNLSVNGPVLPLGSNVLAMTPISPFRPRRWHGALLPRLAEIELKNLDAQKRPVGASADGKEVLDIVSVVVRADESLAATVLFDREHSLEERIFREQFTV